MVMGGVVFSGSSLHDDIRQCAMSVGIRSRKARLAGLCGGSCAPNAMSHSGFPVQHHRHPSRSSAWFRGCFAQGRGFECGLMERVARREGSQRVGRVRRV